MVKVRKTTLQWIWPKKVAKKRFRTKLGSFYGREVGEALFHADVEGYCYRCRMYNNKQSRVNSHIEHFIAGIWLSPSLSCRLPCRSELVLFFISPLPYQSADMIRLCLWSADWDAGMDQNHCRWLGPAAVCVCCPWCWLCLVLRFQEVIKGHFIVYIHSIFAISPHPPWKHIHKKVHRTIMLLFLHPRRLSPRATGWHLISPTTTTALPSPPTHLSLSPSFRLLNSINSRGRTFSSSRRHALTPPSIKQRRLQIFSRF